MHFNCKIEACHSDKLDECIIDAVVWNDAIKVGHGVGYDVTAEFTDDCKRWMEESMMCVRLMIIKG